MVGQTIGKYRVVSRLGRGGMGTVYKAVDETLDREVAIKCLNQDLSESEVLKRFRAEAITLARLNHPNIATLFELTEHQGQMLMVMEFVRGETFEKVVSRVGPMPVDRAVDLCVQALDALGHAHRVGIVHRDLKPANLMLNESGLVKVMDFGLARMAGTEHLTNDGYMVGTPAYMSPEQVLASEIDGRADLYAMGVVLYRLLTGQLPFKADSGIAMVQKQMYDHPTPVRQLRRDLPAASEEILMRALEKKPENRFQTAEDFKSALSRINTDASSEVTRTLTSPSPMAAISVSDQPTLVTPAEAMRRPASTPSTPKPPAAPAPKRNVPAAALVAGVVLLAAIPAFFIYRGRTVPVAGPVDPATSAATSSPAPAAPETGAPSTAAPTATASVPPAAPPAADTAAPSSPTAVAKPPAVAAKPPDRSRPATATPAEPTTAAPPAPPAAPTAAPTAAPSEPVVARPVTVLTFAKLKFLVVEDGKARDRDASLRLDADALHVLDRDTTVETVSYSDVIAVYHSHSKEPKWVTPGGAAVPVMKLGGMFSFLKGTPDWVTVRTKKGFTPLRVPDNDLARLITELEARTGAKAVRTR